LQDIELGRISQEVTETILQRVGRAKDYARLPLCTGTTNWRQSFEYCRSPPEFARCELPHVSPRKGHYDHYHGRRQGQLHWL